MKTVTLARCGRLAMLALSAFVFPILAAAQGPAGAGAAEAAGGGPNSHSYNPTKWFGKKDAKAGGTVSPEELDKKLEPKLREAQVLGADASLKDICRNFLERVDCVAALYSSHKLNVNFECLRSSMTGVRTDAEAASCRVPDNDKPLSLMKTIRLLKPDADAKNVAKEAETAAQRNLKDAAS